MKLKRLQTLLRIAEAQKDAELMTLSSITKRREAIETCRSMLDGEAARAFTLATQSPELGALSALEGFDRLVAERRRAIDHDALEAETDWLAKHDRARVAFGRCLALERIAKKARQPSGGRHSKQTIDLS